MEAALCLGYGPLPSISLRMPSSAIATPVSTKLHFGFNRSSISVSSGRGFTSGRRCRHHVYGPGPLAVLDRSNSSMPSGNEKSVAKVVAAGAVGASLALACALSIIGCRCKMNLKAIAGPKMQVYQKAPSFQQDKPPLTPRKMALKSLLDVTVNLCSKEGRRRRNVDPGPPPLAASRHLRPSKEQIDQLIKKQAVSMMKGGQPDDALHMLNSEYKKYELSDPEIAYNMSMVVVEILICQGKYEEAFDFLSAHYQKISPFDARPTLYKAILCTMLDRDEEAHELWEEFANAVGI
ncbi:hypothetical protein DITRI_Ditri02bG0055800 [Diplodiscus trichospermus]